MEISLIRHFPSESGCCTSPGHSVPGWFLYPKHLSPFTVPVPPVVQIHVRSSRHLLLNPIDFWETSVLLRLDKQQVRLDKQQLENKTSFRTIRCIGRNVK